MAPNQLFAAISRQPFRPFRLHITDGATYDVHHPEMCLVGIRTTEVYSVAEENTDGFKGPVHIDNLHITRMEALPMPTNPHVNGASDE